MRGKKIEIVQTSCRRCDKSISTLSHSLLGADALRAELGEICGDCTTPDEHRRILEGTMQAAVKACQGS
ncbi:hypothetical protein BTH42_33700 [Burkholderia sp. SRS-W-2-2016]|uniref:DUF2688 domain-containing protein n=1 Tax=Burkholderia sp. SRS-W-2-2016 TaxID=1926878 RepID=UPI00094AFD2E|nr:DUF2688 domain-containing protein [Burkholderia sp. SRS-W-2-2016]OLL27288.1 hypothetical protein BTH42_33700 [Burkholderia sp. SRS-W-2-2016]